MRFGNQSNVCFMVFRYTCRTYEIDCMCKIEKNHVFCKYTVKFQVNFFAKIVGINRNDWLLNLVLICSFANCNLFCLVCSLIKGFLLGILSCISFIFIIWRTGPILALLIELVCTSAHNFRTITIRFFFTEILHSSLLVTNFDRPVQCLFRIEFSFLYLLCTYPMTM